MWRRGGGQDQKEADACCPVAVKMLRGEHLQRQAARSSGSPADERQIHLEPWKHHHEAEDALSEIGVLRYLSKQPDLPAYFLRTLGFFAGGSYVWLTTELAEGGELFEVINRGEVLSEERSLRYTWHLLQALAYLHRHGIGHRDISLENALLKDGVAKLMDFGMAVRSRSASGTPLRYFLAVGKEFYRPPECYVPTNQTALVLAPAGAKAGDVVQVQVGSANLCEVRLPPDAVPGRTCRAQLWGYAVEPVDVFSCGICFFMLGYQCPAWPKATLSDSYFAYAHRSGRGVASLLQHWGKPLLSPEAMRLLTDMLTVDPAARPSAGECLGYPCFAGLGTSGDGAPAPEGKGGG
jgi:serine/threonine protein kinase